MYRGSVKQFSLQLKHLSRSMLSYKPKVCTPTDMHLHGILQKDLPRHLLSGGRFLANDDPTTLSSFCFDHSAWQSIGPGLASLITSDSTVASYLGLSSKSPSKIGTCVADKHGPQLLSQALSGSAQSHLPNSANLHVITCTSMVLLNGNTCSVNDYVIVHHTMGLTFVGIVKEIIQHMASVNSVPTSVFIEQADLHSVLHVYEMPLVRPSHHYTSVSPKQQDDGMSIKSASRFWPPTTQLHGNILEEAVVRKHEAQQKVAATSSRVTTNSLKSVSANTDVRSLITV
ncbi:hypothetical protein BDN71DRAFT_1435026 [Pleurotus eryngii]|uniref:Uncharacterized protein n=1 Tax=Pleurotus eryngii TaxID=5323 RepID=A0A9P5ZKI7_PLEER|nr:hypothetical protein BDN71DRAFT_1435026 [Pleurotus eryngii]